MIHGVLNGKLLDCHHSAAQRTPTMQKIWVVLQPGSRLSFLSLCPTKEPTKRTYDMLHQGYEMARTYLNSYIYICLIFYTSRKMFAL